VSSVQGEGGCAQYLPPVFKYPPLPLPPQTIISLPVQIAVLRYRALGAPVVLVAVQLSALGSYLPPVFKELPLYPPQTIISLPVHTTASASRAAGTPTMLVAVQPSVLGSYVPPVSK
jgi:hypothetical protein